MARFIAIDPGASGALCILDDDNPAFIDFKSGGLSDYISFLRHEDPTTLTAVAIEQVASRTGQGVKSVFSFGQRLGELEGMLQTLHIPYTLVSPQRWQRAIHVPPKSGKPGIYSVVSSLYPSAPLTGPKGGIIDGRADALGIAHYLKELHATKVTQPI